MGELVRVTFPDRTSWLAGRGRGIGGSEAGAGRGAAPPQKHPGNEAVEQGRRMESALREFFMAQYHGYDLYYGAYDILYQSDRPWLFATLDGELTEQSSGRKGILEIKTSTVSRGIDWAKWREQVPQNYFTQVLHQMLATGYDFAVLFAALYDLQGNITLRRYDFERREHEADLAWLLEQEAAFWRNVETGTMPGQTLIL